MTVVVFTYSVFVGLVWFHVVVTDDIVVLVDVKYIVVVLSITNNVDVNIVSFGVWMDVVVDVDVIEYIRFVSVGIDVVVPGERLYDFVINNNDNVR